MTGPSPRRLIVEADEADDQALTEELRAAGWRLQRGWEAPGQRFGSGASRVVWVGSVRSKSDAAAAVLAAARGAGVLAYVAPGSPLLGRLHEDLRRIGPVELRRSVAPEARRLDPEQERLLELLSRGCSLAEAGTELGYSLRTINRRLAAAKGALGVKTTAEALAAYVDSKRTT